MSLERKLRNAQKEWNDQGLDKETENGQDNKVDKKTRGINQEMEMACTCM